MLQSLARTAADVFYLSPVTSALIAAIALVWCKTFLNELELQRYASSFKSCTVKGQWWRLLTSPLFHHNPAQMLVNLFILWQCRVVEHSRGSLFVLRYTLVLTLAEGFLSLLILYLIAIGIRARVRWQQSARDSLPVFPGLFEDEEGLNHPRSEQSLSDIIMSQPFGNKPKAGFSGISLAWASFMMVTSPSLYFYLFGILPIPAAFAPVAIILCVLLVEPQHQTPSQSAGFACGLLLALGVLQIVPNLYWSLCFVADVVLLLVFQYLETIHIESCRQAVESRLAAEAAEDDDRLALPSAGGVNSFGLWERRYFVPPSLLAFRSDSDEGRFVRHWDSPAPPSLPLDAAENAGGGGGTVEMNELRIADGATTEEGQQQQQSREGVQAETSEVVVTLPSGVEEDDGESKEWDSLLAR